MTKKSAPKDENQIASSITDTVKRLAAEPTQLDIPNDAATRSAVAKMLGSLGGKKGGPARAEALSPERRKEIAKAASKERWRKYRAAKKVAKARKK